MINEEQMDAWFNYHPPNEETLPRFQVLKATQNACAAAVSKAVMGREAGADLKDTFDLVAAAIRAFADTINEQAPDSSDKSAALRCLRLARMATNESILCLEREDFEGAKRHSVVADAELTKAHWQACAAIACEAASAK